MSALNGERLAAAKLQGRQGFTASGAGVDRAVYAPATGDLPVVFIGVDFPDAPAAEAPDGWRDVEVYANVLADGGARWFERSSSGRLHLVPTVLPGWHRMSRSHHAYGFERGISHATHVEYIAEAVGLAAERATWPAGAVVYVVPPKNATGIKFSPAFIDREGRSERPPSITAHGSPVSRAVTFGQDQWHWGYKVLNHETGHTLGLPDLYAYRPEGSPPNAHLYVGGWDLMGLISGHAPELLAWHKWRLGWIDDAQVTVYRGGASDTFELSPVERSEGPKLVVCPTSEATGLLIESRRPVLHDAGAEDEGVLIYHVDAGGGSGRGTIRILRPGGDTFHPGDLNEACWGPRSRRRAETFRDASTGLMVTVGRQDDERDVVRIEQG